MDYFSMIPDNFFSLLSSKNKRIYLACILQSFKTYETGSILGIEKKIIVDDLINYLDKHTYLYDVEDEEDEEANPQSKRELVNYILRRMEECGWIYIDVTNDYEEIMNFSDMAIIISEALLNAYPSYDSMLGGDGDDYSYDLQANEYQGYIYTIYSLLNNPDLIDYGMTFDLVYSYTKQLIRALRRLDSRLKEYIESVVDTTEVKDLMERLMNFKTEIYDRSYLKMKTSDNINRYRLSIVSKLEKLSSDEAAMNIITLEYHKKYTSYEAATARAQRDIDEVIDVFNSIDGFVAEIDNKNRTYINSTIGKIKFLLSEEDNVIGKLTRILRHVKSQAKINKLDKAMKLVDSLHDLTQFKIYHHENSLYTPRGNYTRNYNQILDNFESFGFVIDEEFIKQFKTAYNEIEIANFLEANLDDKQLLASNIINYDTEDSTVLMTVYSLIYASTQEYDVYVSDKEISHKKYRLRDFMIERRS